MTADAGVARPSRRSAPAPLACQLEPDRWFDRTHRTYTLQQCLACPARRWCAEQALRYKPISGMWAGIWIDGQFDRAARYLRAIAADVPLRHGPTVPSRGGRHSPASRKNLLRQRGCVRSDDCAGANLAHTRLGARRRRRTLQRALRADGTRMPLHRRGDHQPARGPRRARCPSARRSSSRHAGPARSRCHAVIQRSRDAAAI